MANQSVMQGRHSRLDLADPSHQAGTQELEVDIPVGSGSLPAVECYTTNNIGPVSGCYPNQTDNSQLIHDTGAMTR